MAGAKPMSSNGEQVANGVVNREEPLGLRHRFESPHVTLALAGRLVGDFGPVVGVAGGVMHNRPHDDPVCGAVAPKSIGHEAPWDAEGLRLSKRRKNRAAAWRSRRGWSRTSMTSPS